MFEINIDLKIERKREFQKKTPRYRRKKKTIKTIIKTHEETKVRLDNAKVGLVFTRALWATTGKDGTEAGRTASQGLVPDMHL